MHGLNRRRHWVPALAGMVALLLSGCSPQSFFYYPNRKLYGDPATMGVTYETVSYPSLNGKTLWAIWIPAEGTSKGTVVHFHGNWGNVSNHFPLSIFLIKYGFDVLIFDYQGYGASEGRPTPKHTIEDGLASVHYAQQRKPKSGVVVFGQSLGGAAAIVVAAKEPAVKAALIEAAFASYTGMTQEALQRSFLTWPFSFIAPLFVNRSYAPIKYIEKIAPRPVFLIHGDQDSVVPVEMSKKLFEKAREPKRLWILEGKGHLEGRRLGKRYEEEVVRFFEAALKDTTAR